MNPIDELMKTIIVLVCSIVPLVILGHFIIKYW